MKSLTKKAATVYGSIENHGSSQYLEATLPSGKNYWESGHITDDINESYTRDVIDTDGTVVTIIAEWPKK